MVVDLNSFDKNNYERLVEHVTLMNEQKHGVAEAFSFVQDCDRIYLNLRQALLL